MRFTARVAIWAVLLGWSAAATSQDFNNASVIDLHRAGLGESAIIAKIRTLPCHYDVSTEQLIALKKAGVGDEVIVAMVTRCAGAQRAQGEAASINDSHAAHAPGIYLEQPGVDGKPTLTLLRPAAAVGVKTTGNGSILFPFQAKLIVPQPAAQVKSALRRPAFWFYFNTADRKVDSFGTVATIAAQSPNEFSLVRFRQEGGNRQFVIGRVQPYVQVAGIDPRNTIAFATSEEEDGAFRIQAATDLADGEYAFVLSGEKNSYRIYDFSVTAAAAK